MYSKGINWNTEEVSFVTGYYNNAKVETNIQWGNGCVNRNLTTWRNNTQPLNVFYKVFNMGKWLCYNVKWLKEDKGWYIQNLIISSTSANKNKSQTCT